MALELTGAYYIARKQNAGDSACSRVKQRFQDRRSGMYYKTVLALLLLKIWEREAIDMWGCCYSLQTRWHYAVDLKTFTPFVEICFFLCVLKISVVGVFFLCCCCCFFNILCFCLGVNLIYSAGEWLMLYYFKSNSCLPSWKYSLSPLTSHLH